MAKSKVKRIFIEIKLANLRIIQLTVLNNECKWNIHEQPNLFNFY